MSARSSRLRVSGAADSFHRVNNRRSTSPKLPPSTTAKRQRNNVDQVVSNSSSSDSGPGHVGAPTDAPNLQNIDRGSVGGLPQIAGSGFHMPPEVLGQAEDNTAKEKEAKNAENDKKKKPALADLNKAARRRSFLAVKAIKSPAATKAAKAAAKGVVESSSSDKVDKIPVAMASTMFTTIVYGGMEVVFSYVVSHKAIAGVCSRTNFLFQQLNLSSPSPVVSMTSNFTTGMIVVTHEDGIIQTYLPVETNPGNLNKSKKNCGPKSVYGRYRWMDCVTIDAAKVFYNGEERVRFCDRRANTVEAIVDVSISSDCKVLVAHREQLAVFEALPHHMNLGHDSGEMRFQEITDAPLLWTTVLPFRVVTAKISGDGQALAVVIDQADKHGRYGAMTFLHDKDDGSGDGASPDSIGMVYKPGPYLKHAKPITRISFRGLGHVTPTAKPEENQGNDLLLTYCKEDSATRIFNQNSWRQLMLWTAPPNSRADWVRGSSAFTLGDLESPTKSTGNRGMRKSRPNSVSSGLSNETGSISSGLQPTGSLRVTGSGSPTSNAGAWIAEITFRGAYPALRLSRLSYMKRGNDDSQPAHFESIAAILPAGSIIAGSVLDADDMGLSIQGVWPAWNPWLSESTRNDSETDVTGSAMKFLGLSPIPPPGIGQGTFGEFYAGGTHSPPTELRLMASHPKNGNLVSMDFPLWGEADFGAMELGSPIRNVLALSSVAALQKDRQNVAATIASMDYESSRLCAEIDSEGKSISLHWRKEGCITIYSTLWQNENSVFARTNRDLASPLSPDLYQDLSLVPVPLALPPLNLPKGKSSSESDTIISIKWWPDDSFGGPPLLVAITKSRTIIIFEIPPPMFALEPVMPNFDSANAQSSVSSTGTSIFDAADDGSDDEDNDSKTARPEYDVLVTPHPDFGLGLRLESPMDGLPAIAGSFKKNPLNNGILPAEKTGMIQLGDELLSVNGVNLENRTFDDIIATVRHVGAELGPGKPLKLRFRPVPFDRSRKNSAVVHESFSTRSHDRSCNDGGDGSILRANSQDTASLAAMILSNSSETQQEFGRVISVLRKAIPSDDGKDLSKRLLVLPWTRGMTNGSTRKLRAAALLVHAQKNKIKFMRMELPSRMGLDKAKTFDLGVVDVLEVTKGKEQDIDSTTIESIACAECLGEKWTFLISDTRGTLRMLYVKFSRRPYKGNDGPYEMSQEQYIISGPNVDGGRMYTSSSNIFACIDQRDSPKRSIKVWHSRPDASSRELKHEDAIKDSFFDRDFYTSTIVVEPSESDSELIDLCFLKTGYLEAFPTIVAFLNTEAIVYQRRGCSTEWNATVRLSYPGIFTSSWKLDFNDCFGRLSSCPPLDIYPHILRMLRATLPSYDEKNYVLSDWHPETLFAHICTESKGAKFAIRGDVKRTLLWISDKINGSHEDNLSSNVPLLIAPLASWGDEVFNGDESKIDHYEDEVDNAQSLMSSMAGGRFGKSTEVNHEKEKLNRLYELLRRNLPEATGSASSDYGMRISENANNAADEIPYFLSNMSESELLVLRAILKVVIDPPKYGKTDPQGQLMLSIYSIFCEIKQEEKEKHEEKKETSIPKMRGMYVKRQANVKTKIHKLLPQSASAGCLAALLSDYQSSIINTIRQPGQKLSWSTARDMRIPFWLRSDKKLRELCEEIGQQMYRESKDILKSSIFFLVAGKKRTLTNLAAADQSPSGTKLYKFLRSYDFSSQRGRLAAEKNAFSLLRKNQYDSASAFFLLAEPPILKSAVETIATKMGDLDLAFLVARLTETSPSANPAIGRGFGGILGGGGGFAGTGPPVSEGMRDKDSFEDWKRDLGSVAKSLVLDRILPSSQEDSCLSAVQLLWLNRFDEAAHWLTGLVNTQNKNVAQFAKDVTVPCLHDLNKIERRDRESTTLKVNSFVNLVSGPFLLKTMKANRRTLLASTFAVSRSLASIGMEVSALRSLAKVMVETSFRKDSISKLSITATPKIENTRMGAKSSSFETLDRLPPPKQLGSVSASGGVSSSIFDSFDPPSRSQGNGGTMGSSIFDSFDGPSAPKPKAQAPASGAMTSSIFDSFDGPPAPKPKAQAPASGAMTSSIFDSFDGPPAPKPKAPAPASGAMTSSIFDSFDGPPAPKPKAPAPASGAMTSSIFDSFDGPPAPKPKAPAPASGAMTSSIFDSFDGPPAPKPKAPAPSSGAMTSSIFDSFDGPPAPKPKAPAPASGAMTSSIFDSFDGPPAPKPKAPAPSSGAMTSSIFDSFDGPPAPKPKAQAPASGAMTSSIFDSFDGPRAYTSKVTTNTQTDSIIPEAKTSSPEHAFVETAEFRDPPSLWMRWKEDLVVNAAARRLIRELSTLCAPYHCDEFDESGFFKTPLMKSEKSHILQFHADGEDLVNEVRNLVEHLSTVSCLEDAIIVERAMQLLQSPYQVYRTFYLILLLLAIKKVELAEDAVRTASQSLVEKCYSHALSNTSITSGQRCAAFCSMMSSQEFLSYMSWQLELCLWIHRGGALPLSGLALNEAICSVRIGFFVASRNREFKTQEMLMRQPPDCLMDERAGEQLWSSLKIISGCGHRENKVIGNGSGGWEFLVDCRRARATELLREKATGCFILRPHPQDHGVFTISFKTNLIPTEKAETKDPGPGEGIICEDGTKKANASSESRPIRRDDVVQHAIIRLSDSGFRCGSFGPFGTLMDLLQAVSSSLPFDLRFDLPPTEGIIKEEGSKPSPNSAFLRKLGICQADAIGIPEQEVSGEEKIDVGAEVQHDSMPRKQKMFGSFFELMLLNGLRKQLSAVAVAEYDTDEWIDENVDDIDSIGSISDASVDLGVEEEYARGSRILRPLLVWCRMMEIDANHTLAPSVHNTPTLEWKKRPEEQKSANLNDINAGDFFVRQMMKPDSGVEFKTLRLGDGGENAMVMLFRKVEAVNWFVKAGLEMNEDDAVQRLKLMEENRVIEAVDLRLLAPKAYKKPTKKEDGEEVEDGETFSGRDIRYRLVDPWEVEPVENREGETKGASIGRTSLLAFNLSRISSSCEEELVSLGGLPLLELWTALRGNVCLTKAIATVQPPWERAAGGDLLLRDGVNIEPSIYENSIRAHLYRNSLFESMGLPQRFVALIQVELLDLKNLTSPGGSLSLTVYSLLRLKRARSSSPLTSKARTLDSVSTDPVKLTKTSGPNAPASWGSLVRFRYPLPDNTNVEGKCYDRDCESLFKGPPSVLQVSVYEKKFMSDTFLGGADVKLEGLGSGGQLEEWVPLKTETEAINWFARIRLTLKFELMCLASKDESIETMEKLAPSIGRKRIQQLCSVGGAQFDLKQSVSTPDILSYFESYFETD